MPKVAMPICMTCGTRDRVFQCPICSQYSCYECRDIVSDNKCVHVLNELGVHNPEWDLNHVTQLPYKGQ